MWITFFVLLYDYLYMTLRRLIFRAFHNFY